MSLTQFSAIGTPSESNADESRDTAPAKRDDAPEGYEDGGPEFNERRFDSSSELKGLSKRNVPGDVHGIIKYEPERAAQYIPDYTATIDSGIAQQGTAAQRELSGAWGHGTISYTDSIDPLIRDGAGLGGEYFVPNDKAPAQYGAGQYMSSPVREFDYGMAAQKLAAQNSRKAYQGTNYAAWLNGGGI